MCSVLDASTGREQRQNSCPGAAHRLPFYLLQVNSCCSGQTWCLPPQGCSQTTASAILTALSMKGGSMSSIPSAQEPVETHGPINGSTKMLSAAGPKPPPVQLQPPATLPFYLFQCRFTHWGIKIPALQKPYYIYAY